MALRSRVERLTTSRRDRTLDKRSSSNRSGILGSLFCKVEKYPNPDETVKLDRLPSTRLAVEIALLYALFGSLWIILSDRLLEKLFDTPTLVTDIQTLKGWGFVFVTSVGLYTLIHKNVQSLQRSYTLLHTILEGTNDAIFAKDLQGRYIIANSATADCLGIPLDRLIGADDLELFGLETGYILQANDRQTLNQGQTQIIEETVTVGDRERIYLSTKDVWYDSRGLPIGIIGVSRNVTESRHAQQALAQSERRYRTLFECHPRPMWVYDLETLRFLAVNQAAITHYGYSEEEFLAMTIADIRPPEDIPRLMSAIPRSQAGYDYAGVWRHLTREGREIFVEITSHTLEFANRPAEVVLAENITERLQAEAKLERYAFTDTLTELPNRRGFLKFLQQAIDRQQCDRNESFALFYLSLDDFARIKFSLGHNLANQLAVESAHRLTTCLPQAICARVGEREFALLLPHPPNSLTDTIDHLQQALSQEYYLDRRELFTNISIGVVLSDIGYEDAENYLQAGDIAMHQAKQTGPPKCIRFNHQLRETALHRLELDTALRRALERHEFCLHYQPLVDLQSQRTLGFEALVRWQNPQRGLVPPNQFVPLAEETGLIIHLGEWVLREACWQLRDWRLRFGLTDLTMSVNVAAVQLMQSTFVDLVEDVLQETGIPPACLKLEITETTLMQNTQRIAQSLQKLEQLGVILSIDDFGTGYSSLSYLLSFPFRILKLDRSFVMHLGQNAKSLAIVRNVALLAQTLQLELVAEGIETDDQRQELQRLGFQAGQGYWFLPPRPASQIEPWLLQSS